MEIAKVFPTCVGVFPFQCSTDILSHGLPHVRGGVSCLILLSRFGVIVFPTCVGVFLLFHSSAPFFNRLPHVRGGVSPSVGLSKIVQSSSPRAWGCFSPDICPYLCQVVFPTCVGVFLIGRGLRTVNPGLPHVRGGVSTLF
mgnify:CR=1 FL=1